MMKNATAAITAILVSRALPVTTFIRNPFEEAPRSVGAPPRGRYVVPGMWSVGQALKPRAQVAGVSALLGLLLALLCAPATAAGAGFERLSDGNRTLWAHVARSVTVRAAPAHDAE